MFLDDQLSKETRTPAVQGTNTAEGKKHLEEHLLADVCLMVDQQNYQYVTSVKTAKKLGKHCRTNLTPKHIGAICI